MTATSTPSRLLTRLDAVHATMRRSATLARFTLLTRLLLAVAFAPTGLVKLLGHRFTSLPLESTVGFFFEALYRSGGWYRFIGGAQVTAALLLLVPATAFLGAALFLPIVVNIFVITVSVGFTGTPWITGPMVLANLWLLAWEWHRWRGAFAPPPAPSPPGTWSRLEIAGWCIGGGAAMAVLLGTRSMVPWRWVRPSLAVGAGGGIVVLSAWVREALRARRA